MHPADDPDSSEIPTCAFVSGFGGLLLAHRLLGRAAGVSPASPALMYPLNLAGPRAITMLGLTPRADCPVGCVASTQQRGEGSAASQ
jgi:hypothetical protein